MNKRDIGEISWKSCLKLGVAALAVYLCIRYWGGFEGFLVILLNGIGAILAGMVIAYVVNIPMRFYERVLPGETGDGTLNRTLAMILAIVSIVAVLLFVLLLVIPQLVDAVVTLAKDVPSIVDSLMHNEFIASLLPANIVSQIENFDWSALVGNAASWLQSGVTSALPQIASIFGVIGAWFMGIIFALWYLAEKNKLGAQCHRLVRNYLGAGVDEKLIRTIELLDDCFHRYIVAQSLEALIFGTLVTIGAAIIGLPNALMLGSLVGVMSLIPMVGALIGGILGALIILATSWQKALIFLIVFFVVQQIEANVVYRRVVGKRVGLTGMWPLIGVMMGATLFGIAGAFIGVPVTAAIFRIVDADLARREELPEDTPTPLDMLHKSLSD